jgi:hypothetical protein
MLAGFGGGIHIMMAAEVTDHEPAEEVFRTVSESVLEIVFLGLEFLLHPTDEEQNSRCANYARKEERWVARYLMRRTLFQLVRMGGNDGYSLVAG